ncbi:MAG: hypothetical protein HY291_06525 [Planctomycetes bacterium]|nr:hypothetical protein [Planctomycetota bacterium]
MHALFLAALVLSVIAAAECLGPRLVIYLGAMAGGLLGLVGWAFGLAVLARQRFGNKDAPGKWDIWPLWSSGFLLRVVMLGGMCWGFTHAYGANAEPALYSMAGVYLTTHLWETAWLYRALVKNEVKTG